MALTVVLIEPRVFQMTCLDAFRSPGFRNTWHSTGATWKCDLQQNQRYFISGFFIGGRDVLPKYARLRFERSICRHVIILLQHPILHRHKKVRSATKHERLLILSSSLVERCISQDIQGFDQSFDKASYVIATIFCCTTLAERNEELRSATNLKISTWFSLRIIWK